MKILSIPCQIKVLSLIIMGLVLSALSLNLLLLAHVKLMNNFKWVNELTGLALVVALMLSWLAKKRLEKQKTCYVHKIFSKN